MANRTTTYYAPPELVAQLHDIVLQMRQQIVLIERYLRAIDQAIALEPLPGEVAAPGPPDQL